MSGNGEEFDLIFGDKNPAPGPNAGPAPAIAEFNEQAYVAAYPEVGRAVSAGSAATPREHYARIGRAERRLQSAHYLALLSGGQPDRIDGGHVAFNVDTVVMGSTGTVFLVGWIDDRTSPLASASVMQDAEGWNTRGIARCRRPDVEELLGARGGHAFGFWLVHQLGHPGTALAGDMQGAMTLRARLADGRVCLANLAPRHVPDSELRDTILGHFAHLQYLGSPQIEAFGQLDTGAGAAILALNRGLSSTIASAAHIERFGPARARFAASFIICLLGRPEYFFLQSALFATGAGAGEIEFIYVSNSPELAETLQKEARIAERVYGLSVTLVTLPGNAGFSVANNAAARVARSGRLVFVNPDVFPRDDGWAVRHAHILQGAPAEHTMLFGAPLHYDDGSLMHGGMYFEVDQGLSVTAGGVRTVPMIRVEHYGKGAPAWSDAHTRPRPVPAVTGAFISADRAWFERLGGFTGEYVFGHYEDADLCLKSLQHGVPAWLHDIRFWHLEGKGSVRRPAHEGGSLVNRWHFTRTWGRLIEASLCGRTPTHPLLNGVPGWAPLQAEAVAATPVARPARRTKERQALPAAP